MTRWVVSLPMAVLAIVVTSGCTTIAGTQGAADDAGGESDTVDAVASKAVDVANMVGGENGFGGTLMHGYAEHGPTQMGFHDSGDLAVADQGMMVRLHNDTDDACTFDLSYFASHVGFDEQMMTVHVDAGQEATVELPCSEIVGLGQLEMPGEPGCLLEGGEEVDNRMAVPGFLGLDFECNGSYDCWLEPDEADLDGDGDTEELVIVSGTMQLHMMNGGPMGHHHGDGADNMMGSHLGM